MTATKRPWPGPDIAPYRKGNLMDWVSPRASQIRETATDHYALPDEWRNNVPFEATLTLTGTERGRSAARFMWDDGHGNTFPMFLTDATDLMMSREGVAGAVAAGWWVVVKRGQSYGIRRIPEGSVGVPHCPVTGGWCSTCRIGAGNGSGGTCARTEAATRACPGESMCAGGLCFESDDTDPCVCPCHGPADE